MPPSAFATSFLPSFYFLLSILETVYKQVCVWRRRRRGRGGGGRAAKGEGNTGPLYSLGAPGLCWQATSLSLSWKAGMLGALRGEEKGFC